VLNRRNRTTVFVLLLAAAVGVIIGLGLVLYSQSNISQQQRLLGRWNAVDTQGVRQDTSACILRDVPYTAIEFNQDGTYFLYTKNTVGGPLHYKVQGTDTLVLDILTRGQLDKAKFRFSISGNTLKTDEYPLDTPLICHWKRAP